MTDDLDDLLGPTPPTPNHHRLQAAILQATTRLVRRRLWFRRARIVALAASVFLLGGLAGWLVKPTPVEREPEVVVLPVPVPIFPAPPMAPSEQYVSAEEFELQAEQANTSAETARLYRLAADQFLTARSDYGQAARCYRLHLLAAGPAGHTISVEDSWLLISLKTTPAQENRNAP